MGGRGLLSYLLKLNFYNSSIKTVVVLFESVNLISDDFEELSSLLDLSKSFSVLIMEDTAALKIFRF